MPKYTVQVQRCQSFNITVRADSPTEAIEVARDVDYDAYPEPHDDFLWEIDEEMDVTEVEER